MRDKISALICRVKDRAAWTLLRAAARWDNTFSEKALVVIGERSPEALRGFVAIHANELAKEVVMNILEREGIVHCALCPQRFGLAKVGGRYACLKHSEEVKARAA